MKKLNYIEAYNEFPTVMNGTNSNSLILRKATVNQMRMGSDIVIEHSDFGWDSDPMWGVIVVNTDGKTPAPMMSYVRVNDGRMSVIFIARSTLVDGLKSGRFARLLPPDDSLFK